MNLPLLLAASVLPDVDLFLRFLMHRGPTHSIITITILMIPLFIIYRKQAAPYYAVLLSHVLIGDFFTGGTQLFWPLSQNLFGALNIDVTSLTNAIVELGLFLITIPIMYKKGDLQTLLKPLNKNWALIIPLVAVLGPLISAGRGSESALPPPLIAPSLFYLGLFTYSILIELRARKNQNPTNPNQPEATKQLPEAKLQTANVYISKAKHPKTKSVLCLIQKINCCDN